MSSSYYGYITTIQNISWNVYFLPQTFLSSITALHYGIPVYTGLQTKFPNLISVKVALRNRNGMMSHNSAEPTLESNIKKKTYTFPKIKLNLKKYSAFCNSMCKGSGLYFYNIYF